MNIKFFYIIFIFILFPTFSFFNIGLFPLLRVDFVGQILLLIYISIKVFNNNIKIKKVEFILFVLLILVYSCSNLLNVFNFDSFNVFNFFKMFIQSVFIFLICFLILNLDLQEFDMFKLYKFLINIGIIISLYAFYQIISWNITELPFDKIVFNTPNLAGESVVSGFNGFLRPTSIFKEPTHFAFVLQIIMIISLFAYKYKLKKLIGLTNVKMFIFIIAFLSTISLFNFISLFVVLVFFFKYPKYLFIGLIPIFIILLDLNMLGPFIRIDHFLYVIFSGNINLAGGSFIVRIGRALIGIKIWLDHFWIGVGLNNLGFFAGNYHLGSWYHYSTNIVFTNVFYIQALAETGILGTLILTLFFVFIFKKLKYKNIIDTKIIFIARLSFALMVAFLVNQDLPFSSSYRLLYLILIFMAINKVKEYKGKCKGKWGTDHVFLLSSLPVHDIELPMPRRS